MNNAVFGKTMENVRNHRDIKLVTTDKRRNQLVSEPNYHTTKWFSEKSEGHDIYTKEINKIALSSNDDKRFQTFDGITTYPYGTSAGKVWKTELLSKVDII